MKRITIFLLLDVLLSICSLNAQVESTILVGFTPAYASTAAFPTQDNISINFTPQYLAVEDQIAVNFTPNYFFLSSSSDGVVSLESSTDAITVSIIPIVSSSGSFALSRVPTGFELISEFYDLQPDGFMFDPPAILTFNFNDNPLEETNYTLFRYDVGTSVWVQVSSQTLDIVNNKITAVLLSVSYYAIFKRAPIYIASLVFGDQHSLNHPEGIAVDSTGKIYVTDTNNDLVKIFSSTGAMITQLGFIEKENKKFKEDDDDHDKKGEGNRGKKEEEEVLHFNKPRGIALDYDSNIYVADTNNNRVLKMSATGAVLLEIGKIRKDEAKHGKRPGEFNKPTGVALDIAGNIYVADKNNGRIKKYDSQGNFMLEINIAVDAALASNEEDETLKPFGIAVDSHVNIYVSDRNRDQVLKYDSQGVMVQSIGHSGANMGQFKKPSGIFVNTQDNLFVVDRNNNRIQQFGRHGNVVNVFGAKGHAVGQFNKPIGVFVDSSGEVYITDTNNSRIQKFIPQQVASTPIGNQIITRPVEHHVEKKLVSAIEGGEVSYNMKHKVMIPPRALPKDLEISLTEIVTNGPIDDLIKEKSKKEKKVMGVSPQIEFGPEGTQFNDHVTITISYSTDAFKEQPGDNLNIAYWNPKKSVWEILDSVVDRQAKNVSAKIDHFSLYQILAPAPPLASEQFSTVPDSVFQLGEVYAFPNPSVGGRFPTIHMECGVPDSIELKIYDLSGDLVHEARMDQKQLIVNEKYAYEYTWDTTNIASGIYVYVVQARKNGEKDIKVMKKLAVVK